MATSQSEVADTNHLNGGLTITPPADRMTLSDLARRLATDNRAMSALTSGRLPGDCPTTDPSHGSPRPARDLDQFLRQPRSSACVDIVASQFALVRGLATVVAGIGMC
jgi:hypothetical protein